MDETKETRVITNPVKAIRAKCLDCCCEQVNEVKLCPIEDCALYPFRFGKNPYRKRVKRTEEQKKVMTENLAKARNNREYFFIGISP